MPAHINLGLSNTSDPNFIKLRSTEKILDVSGLWEALSMSIAELPNRGNNSNNRIPATVEFERTPPQDLIAEQGVLGGMLLSKE